MEDMTTPLTCDAVSLTARLSCFLRFSCTRALCRCSMRATSSVTVHRHPVAALAVTSNHISVSSVSKASAAIISWFSTFACTPERNRTNALTAIDDSSNCRTFSSTHDYILVSIVVGLCPPSTRLPSLSHPFFQRNFHVKFLILITQFRFHSRRIPCAGKFQFGEKENKKKMSN